MSSPSRPSGVPLPPVSGTPFPQQRWQRQILNTSESQGPKAKCAAEPRTVAALGGHGEEDGEDSGADPGEGQSFGNLDDSGLEKADLAIDGPIHPDRSSSDSITRTLGLLPPVVEVLRNRGLDSIGAIETFLDPDRLELPDPATEFEDLALSVQLLATAVTQGQKIAICGDYDADGMTSTALLIRALRGLGGVVDYAIPSRMQEGYGINERIVEEFHAEGVSLVLTVDNGIAAYGPIARARELGLRVIVTDHHDLPPLLPPADGILNPKLLPETSVYRGLAGVGVAYILAVALTDYLGQSQAQAQVLMQPLLELFTLGTIADLAPLVGVNRCWVKQGLNLLARSQILGIQTLIPAAGIQVAEADQLTLNQAQNSTPPGVKASKPQTQTLKPEDIGFRLGPRINAIGRIGDPQVVIELLITEDAETAQQRATECEAANNQRKKLCEEIEQAAIALAERQRSQLVDRRVLLVVGEDWHHGVIGIVASRLVERYGVPVFIATGEDAAGEHIRGSARGIPEFHVAEALEYCTDLLEKHGGHRAAGGFSLRGANLEAFHQRLIAFANQCLAPEHLKPLVEVDTALSLADIDGELFHQIDRLHPWGIGNPEPVFWSEKVRVLEQRQIGQNQTHLKLTLGVELGAELTTIKAVAWRWGEYYPLPEWVDVAYRLRENEWRGTVTIELELVGLRLSKGSEITGYSGQTIQNPVQFPKFSSIPPSAPSPSSPDAAPALAPGQQTPTVSFSYGDRPYSCAVYDRDGFQELRIRNGQGQVLAVQEGQAVGLLGTDRASARSVNIQEPFFYNLIQQAVHAIQTRL